MKNGICNIIISVVAGMVIGSVVTGFAVNNSFQKDYEEKAEKYECLIQRIAEDNPTYVDDILCETDEWYEVYGD